MAVREDEVAALLEEPAPTTAAPAAGVTEADVEQLLADPVEPAQRLTRPYQEERVPGGLKVYRPGGAENPQIYARQVDQLEPVGGRLKATLNLMYDPNVDRMATVRELSRRTGLTAGMVDAQFDHVKKFWELSNFDEPTFRRQHPWFARIIDEQPGLANIVVRDQQASAIARTIRGISAFEDAYEAEKEEAFLSGEAEYEYSGIGPPTQVTPALSPERKAALEEKLTDIEAKKPTVMRTGEAPTGFIDTVRKEYSRNALGIEKSELGFALMLPGRGEQERKDIELRLIDLEREMLPVEGRPQLITDVTAGLPSNIDVVKAGGTGAVVGGVLGAAAAVVTRQPAKAWTFAKVTGSFFGKGTAALRSFQQEAGGAFLEYRGMKLDDGRALPAEAAAGAALLYGALSASVEMVSLGAQTADLRGALSAGLAKRFLRDKLKDATFRQLALRAGKAWLAAGGTEAGEEATQHLLQDLIGYLQRSDEAGEFQKADPLESAVGTAEAFYAGGLGGLAFGGATTLPSLALPVVTGALKQSAAQRSAHQVEALAELSMSPFAKADPEAAARVVQEAAAESGSPITGAHVDPVALVTLFQSENLNPATVLGQEAAQQLDEAIESGGLVELPLAMLADESKLGQYATRLKKDISTRADLPTENQRAQAAEELKLTFELAKQFEKEGTRAESVAESRFVEAIEKQLVATGQVKNKDARTKMNLWRAIIRTMPERWGEGVTADQLFDRFAVAVGNAEAVEIATAEDARQPQPGARDAIIAEFNRAAKAGEISQPERQARALLLDRNTGFLNARGFRMLSQRPPADRPFLAEFDMEGQKYFNDKRGHASYDGALRLMAGALRDAGITDAGQVGGSIKAWVANAKQAEDLATAMQQAVGGRLRVTTAVGGHLENLDRTYEGVGEAHKAFKDAERAATPARLSGRKDRPLPYQRDLDADLEAELFAKAPAVDRFAPAFDVSHLSDDIREKADELDAPWLDLVLQDETGMLTDDGFAEAQRVLMKAWSVSADMRGLRDMNDAFGKQATNVILKEFKKLIVDEGGQDFDAAHPHGDEFYFQGDDKKKLQRFMYQVKRSADRLVFYQPMSGGRVRVQVGVSFASGIAENLDKADRVELPKAKEAQLEYAKPVILSRAQWAKRRRELRAERYSDPVRLPDLVEEELQGSGGGVRLPVSGGVQPGQPAPGPGGAEGGVGAPASRKAGADRGVINEITAELSDEEVAAIKKQVKRLRSKERRRLALEWINYCLDPELPRPPIHEHPDLEEYLFEKHIADPLGVDMDLEGKWQRGTTVGSKKQNAANRRTRWKDRGMGARAQEKAATLRRAVTGRAPDASGRTVFQDPDTAGGKERGFTTIADAGMRRIYRIALNPNADLSTFLHETAHVFLDIFEQLAGRDDAPAKVKADYEASLNWLGIEKLSGLSREEYKAAHEKWARGFEAYLREGKAPSPRLASAFQRFHAWLVRIYRSIRQLDVELNDEIRGVFDRLLATDDEIASMQRQMGLAQPLFQSPDDMARARGRAVSPEEWQAYLDERLEAHRTGNHAVAHRVMKDRLRESERWWQEELRRQKDIAEQEFEALPGRLAQMFLWGRSPDSTAKGDVIHLDRAVVEGVVGPGNARKFPLRKTGGEHPDRIAPFYGFNTGAQMLGAILALPDKAQYAEERAHEAMREKFPELLDEREKLREEVAKGLHGDFTVRWLIRELAALTRGSTGADVVIRATREAAAIIASRRTVRKLDPGGVLAKERQAAQNAVKAAAKGNFAQAAIYKRQQLLNVFLFKELSKAKEDRDELQDLAGELGKAKARARLGKASPAYRGVVDRILEGLGFREKEDRDQDLPTVDQAIAVMEANATSVMFDPSVVNQALQKTDWKDLSVAELREVLAALKNLRKAASTRNTVLLEGRRVSKDWAVQALVAEARSHLEKMPEIATRPSRTRIEKLQQLGNSTDGWLLRIETMVDMLSGDRADSNWQRLVIQPLQGAKHLEADIVTAGIKPIIDAFEVMKGLVRARFTDAIDGATLFPNHRSPQELIAPPRERYELLMMALNAGNEGNLQRLLDGRNIARAELDAALSTLTKEEMDWVQSVFDAHEKAFLLPGETEAKSLKQRAFDLEERDSGIRPEEVKPIPIVTPQGTWRGGYFPVVYVPEETTGTRQESEQLAQVMDPSFTSPGTSHAYLKKRADRVVAAVSLDPRTVYGHLAKVAHDLAFREPLKSVASLLLTPAVQGVLAERLGYGKAKLFLPWLKDIGTARAGVSMGGFDDVAKFFRGNMAPALLGYRPSLFIGDAANFALVRAGLRSGFLGKAMKDLMADPDKYVGLALEKSGELRFRRDQLARDFAQSVKDLTRKGIAGIPAVAAYKEHGFMFMEWSDKLVTTPAWLAAYRQALEDGLADKDAVITADKFVRDRFASHSAVDTAHILRDKGFWGAITVFAGWTNMLYNRQRRLIAPWTRETKLGRAILVGKLFAFWTVANVLPAFLMGQGPEEGEGWLEWYLRRLALAPFENFHGETVGLVSSVFGQKTTPRTSVTGAFLGSLGNLAIKATQGNADAWRLVRDALRAMGLGFGIPITPAVNALDAAQSIVEGEGALEVAEDVLYGERKTKSPLDLGADVVDLFSGEKELGEFLFGTEK